MRNLRYGLQEKSAHRFNTLADILSKIARKVSKNRKFKLNQQALINAFNTIAVERYWTLDQRLLQGYLSVILGQILNHTELVEREKTVSFLPELLTYLSKHFMEPLTLDNLAHHLGVSKYQISRFFSQKIGCNFSTYLNALRVQHAEKLLTATDFPVTEICYLAGFESLSTFYRVFSQINGISPTAYKKKY